MFKKYKQTFCKDYRIRIYYYDQAKFEIERTILTCLNQRSELIITDGQTDPK